MRSEWTIKTISDIASINPREKLSKGTIAKKIAMDKLRPFCREVLGFEMETFSGGTKFRNGDTIMARITPCLENGKTAKIKVLDDDEVGFGSTEYIVFRAKEGNDPDFLYYLVTSPIVREPAIKSMVGTSGRQRVQTDVVKGLKVRVPNLVEQRKIASMLSALDDKIELNEKINQNLEEQAESYFYNHFIANADSSWREGTISDIGTVVGGSTPSKAKPEYYTDNGIAWITPKDLSVDKSKFISHGANDITELGLKNSSTSKMPTGTVLFSSRAPIGYIAIADGEVTTNQGFKSVVPNCNVGTAFTYYSLKNALPTIVNMASGSTFKEISGGAMRNVPTIIPDDVSLQEFTDFCDPLFQQQRTLEAENRSLAVLRDSLLPKLMSGEIDVSALDI